MDALGFFRELVAAQKRGEPRGITSVCSANPRVLAAAMEQAAADGVPVLIESTVNQVNQFGGYTGMTPRDFRGLVLSVAQSLGFPPAMVFLGGDHLGPYPWRGLAAREAMDRSRALVAESVRAGYHKIHLDASMPLGGDAAEAPGGLSPETVADREAELAVAAEEAFRERRAADPGASPPVYVIGTEVPPPGGIVSAEEAVPVTRVEDFRQTVSLCAEAFRRRGLGEAWGRVCAVVAQPGVEYGDQEVHPYERERAAALAAAARAAPGLVMEGHSTDYQSPGALRGLVQDGVAILKVGPALTFALRECLFALEHIEAELLGAEGSPRAAETGGAPSRLAETMEALMQEDPSHWKGYYGGTEGRKRLARRYSLSDRIRYYWTAPAAQEAVGRLLANLRRTGIPLTLLGQFLPDACRAVREGRLGTDPEGLLRHAVRAVLRDYSAAVSTSPRASG
jgi:D-tagatose-1,6-bisphosphate aldolase subunit GatZ/KbaZ